MNVCLHVVCGMWNRHSTLLFVMCVCVCVAHVHMSSTCLVGVHEYSLK